MSKPIIEVRNLAKRYRLGQIGMTTLREEVEQWFHRAKAGPVEKKSSDFWALRDVSFDVHSGEVLGIIGRNGAGKSTLLKILSRITEPTSGEAVLRGRVASLLEVGTGFHPELTGRENIYLNGAILGMKKREIDARFDEIVDFAEMGPFIDTPVKRYSSGMYVRLAFAVAAHLDPDILIVDEVLAVGDARFQSRCLNRMGTLAGSGRTVLLVSHNLALVQALCRRVVWLQDGRVCGNGDPGDVAGRYAESGRTAVVAGRIPEARNDKFGAVFRILGSTLEDRGEGLEFSMEMELETARPLQGLGFGFKLLGPMGEMVIDQPDPLTRFYFAPVAGTQKAVLSIPRIGQFLNGGHYRVDCWIGLAQTEYVVQLQDVAVFELPAVDLYGTGMAAEARKHGHTAVKAVWNCRAEEEGGG
jgi:lipopolysaccharide transport system ATP-binding protein